MLLFIILTGLALSLTLILALVMHNFGKWSEKDREKLSPFECGFDPLKKARMPFSLRFFLVTIIFLIFEVEVAILLPLALILPQSANWASLTLALLLTIILIAGLLHEWLQGALNWT